MKKFYSLTIVISLCLTSVINAAEKNAIMLEKFKDPFAGMVSTMGAENVAKSRSTMGDAGKIVEYRHCIQNISVNKSSFKKTAQYLTEESSEGGEFNDTKSVTLIDKCPLPANASCDKKIKIDYFYTDSNTPLDSHKSGCEYSKHKWSSNIKDLDDTKIVKEEPKSENSKDAHLKDLGRAVKRVLNSSVRK